MENLRVHSIAAHETSYSRIVRFNLYVHLE